MASWGSEHELEHKKRTRDDVANTAQSQEVKKKRFKFFELSQPTKWDEEFEWPRKCFTCTYLYCCYWLLSSLILHVRRFVCSFKLTNTDVHCVRINSLEQYEIDRILLVDWFGVFFCLLNDKQIWKELLHRMTREIQSYKISVCVFFIHFGRTIFPMLNPMMLAQRSMFVEFFCAEKLNEFQMINWIGEMPEWWIWRVLYSTLKEHFYLYSFAHSCNCHISQCTTCYWKVWIFSAFVSSSLSYCIRWQ